MSLNDLANAGVVAFAKLAGLKKDAWFDRQVVEELNQSRELDITGLTTVMMLRGFLDQFAESTTFNAREVIQAPDAFIARVDAVRTVYTLLDASDAVAAVDAFMQRVALLMKRSTDKTKSEWVHDAGEVGFIRRDAYRSMRELDPFQFTRGAAESATLSVNQTVFEFWNINSLLRALQQQRLPGVSLCLLRDPDEVMASYFVFAIRNGDNITILTDREAGPHPLYWQMSRRPERQLDRRAARHRFPYHLLELKRDEKQRLRKVDRTALVPYQQTLVPLCKLEKLPADIFLWVHMVLELLAEEYGHNNKQLPALAYTGEMVVHPDALVSPGSALMRQGYQPLELPRQTMANVTAETTAHQWEYAPQGVNEWMVTRYAKAVPPEALNVVGTAQALQIEATHGKQLKISKRDEWGERKNGVQLLEALMPTNFGLAADIARDLQWTARVNQCKVIQRAAEAEYETTKVAIRAWVQERIRVNHPALVEWAARGIQMEAYDNKRFAARDPGPTERNMVRVLVRPENRKAVHEFDRTYGAFSLGKYDGRTRLEWRCAITGKEASVFAAIDPMTTVGLAQVCGCAIEDLPEQLQHWMHSDIEPYHGNSILDRIDPSDWILRNPWNHGMRFQVWIPVNLTAWRAVRNQLGLAGDIPESEPGKQPPMVIRLG